MRRLTLALRSMLLAIANAIGLEGALILAGLGGIAYVGWTFDWRLGVAIVCTPLLLAGLYLVRPPQPPRA